MVGVSQVRGHTISQDFHREAWKSGKNTIRHNKKGSGTQERFKKLKGGIPLQEKETLQEKWLP